MAEGFDKRKGKNGSESNFVPKTPYIAADSFNLLSKNCARITLQKTPIYSDKKRRTKKEILVSGSS